MRVGDEQVGDEILVLGVHALRALAAALLLTEFVERRALDVALMCDGDDHVFALDQVFVIHIAGIVDNLGTTRHGELLAHICQFV